MKNILLSLFQGYTDKRPTPTQLDNIVEMIRNHAPTAAHTEKFRYNSAHGWDREASREKASCPCFAVAVHFNGGKLKTDIQDWTMLCLADFDHLPAEEMNHALELIRKDPHTLLAYTTISGTGIRVISRYFRGQNCQARSPYDLHLQAFAQINQYYAELIGHPYDEKCKNATRLSGLAHDPDVFFNPEAEAFCIESKMLPKKNEKETPNRPLKRAVRAAERQLADEGVEYIEHHHNEYIMRTGYLLNAYGIPLETATQWALKRFGDYEGDVAGIFRSCYQQTEEHGTLRLPSSSRPTDETEGKPANVAEIEEFRKALTESVIATYHQIEDRYRDCENTWGDEEMFYDLSVTPIKGNDTFKAEASMKIQDAFVVHQMHVIQGWNGNTFVGMPQKPNTQKGKKEDIAHAVTADFKKELDEAVMERYNQILEYQKQALTQKNKNAR